MKGQRINLKYLGKPVIKKPTTGNPKEAAIKKEEYTEPTYYPRRYRVVMRGLDLDNLIYVCTEKLEQNPDHPKALFIRASSLMKKGEYKIAINDCNKLISVDPFNAGAYYVRGTAFEKLGQLEQCIADFTRVLEIDPNHINAAYSRGAAENKRGNYTKAIEDYVMALQKDQNFNDSSPRKVLFLQSAKFSFLSPEKGPGEIDSGTQTPTIAVGKQDKGTGMNVNMTKMDISQFPKTAFSQYESQSRTPELSVHHHPTHPKPPNRGSSARRGVQTSLDRRSISPKGDKKIAESRIGLYPKYWKKEKEYMVTTENSEYEASPIRRNGERYIQKNFSRDTWRPPNKQIKSRNCRGSKRNNVEEKGNISSWPLSKSSKDVSIPIISKKIGGNKKEHSQQLNINLNSIVNYNFGGSNCRSEDMRNMKSNEGIEGIEGMNSPGGSTPTNYIEKNSKYSKYKKYTRTPTKEARNLSSNLQLQVTSSKYNTHEGNMGDSPVDTVSQGNPPSAEDLHNEGYDARREGNFCMAITLYSQAILTDPTLFKAWFNRGFAYDKAGRMSEAVKDYSTAIRLDPTNPYTYYNRGITLDRMGDYDEAIKDFSQAISLDQTKSDFYHNRGFAYRKKLLFDKAIIDYSYAMKLDPSHFKAYYNRAFCHETLNQLLAAEADYLYALQLKPASVSAIHHLATVQEKIGGDKLISAILNFNRLIQLNPSFGPGYNGRGLVRDKIDKYEEAVADFSKAIILDPSNPVYFHNRAGTYRKMGHLEKSIEDYTSALNLDSKNGIIYSNRGMVKRKLKDYESAIEDFTQELGLLGQTQDMFNTRSLTKALNNRAFCYAKLSEYSKAIQDYTAVLHIDNSNIHALHNRGISYERLAQYISAIEDFTQVISNDPNNANAYFNRGCCYDSMGELNKAIEDYTVALDKDAESTNEQSISSSPLSQHTRSISTTIK